MALTPKQEALAAKLNQVQIDTVLGVVAGKSQRQSYIEAGGNGSTNEALDAAASKLLSLDKVVAFKNSLLEGIVNDAILTRERALERLTLVAETEITDILEFRTVEVKKVGKDGEEETDEETIWLMKDSPDVQRRARAAIKSVTMTKQGPKIEMYDATAAMAQIAKMQGWDAPAKIAQTDSAGNDVKPDATNAVLAALMRKHKDGAKEE